MYYRDQENGSSGKRLKSAKSPNYIRSNLFPSNFFLFMMMYSCHRDGRPIDGKLTLNQEELHSQIIGYSYGINSKPSNNVEMHDFVLNLYL